MPKDIKFSIIMPVYNVEKYLSKSLDSLVNQTYKNLEIICVNDNSTDKSLEILKEYANKDTRFIIIDLEENKGPGATRNIALQKVSGDYVSFVDSDDWLESNAFEEIVIALKKYNYPRILQFDFKEVFENSDLIRNYDFCSKIKRRLKYDISKYNYYTWQNFGDKFFSKNLPACWNKVYSRNFLLDNDIKFTLDEGGEDVAFTYKALLQDVKIYYLHKYLYNYFKRNSLGRKYSKERLAYIDYLRVLKEHLETKKFWKKLDDSFNSYKMHVIEERAKCIVSYGFTNREALLHFGEYLTDKEFDKLLKEMENSSFYKKIFSVEKIKIDGKRCFTFNVFGRSFCLGKNGLIYEN